MTEDILIETEQPDDIAVIRDLTIRAFDGRNEEADLIDGLREGRDLLLSLTARYRGEIVGHVAFSRVIVDDPAGPDGAVGLAPMSVLPDMQQRGIGARLIEAGLDQLAAAGESVVLVVGNPAYYTRFGFSVSAAEAYPCDYSGPHFMARLLGDLAAPRGPVTYPDAFELVN